MSPSVVMVAVCAGGVTGIAGLPGDETTEGAGLGAPGTGSVARGAETGVGMAGAGRGAEEITGAGRGDAATPGKDGEAGGRTGTGAETAAGRDTAGKGAGADAGRWGKGWGTDTGRGADTLVLGVGMGADTGETTGAEAAA